MATLNRIKLTPADVLCDLVDENQKARTVRSVEVEVLESLAVVAANNQEDCAKMNVCFDLIEEIMGITPEMDSFKITPSDLKELLMPAIRKTVGRRPSYWYYARKLFKMLEKPEEIAVN